MKSRNKKLIASVTTGAMLAGVGAIAYFAASEKATSALTTGTIALEAALTGLGDKGGLNAVGDQTGDGQLTKADFVGLEDQADDAQLKLSTPSPVTVDVVLASLTVGGDTSQVPDLRLGICTGDQVAWTDDDNCALHAVGDLVSSPDTFTVTGVDGAGYTGTLYLWLVDSGAAQDQAAITTLNFTFEGRSNGAINQDRDGDGVPNGQDSSPDTPTAPTNDGEEGAALPLPVGDGFLASYAFPNSAPGQFSLGDGDDLVVTVFKKTGAGNFGLARHTATNVQVILNGRAFADEGDQSGYKQLPNIPVTTDGNGQIKLDLDAADLEGADTVSVRTGNGTPWSYYNAIANGLISLGQGASVPSDPDGGSTAVGGTAFSVADLLDMELNPASRYSLLNQPLVDFFRSQDGGEPIAAFIESQRAHGGDEQGKSYLLYISN